MLLLLVFGLILKLEFWGDDLKNGFILFCYLLSFLFGVLFKLSDIFLLASPYIFKKVLELFILNKLPNIWFELKALNWYPIELTYDN